MFARARHFQALFLVPLLLACDGDDEGTGPDSEPDPVATSLEITTGTETLTAIGDTVRLEAEVRDQDDEVMANAAVTWSSLDADGGGLARLTNDAAADLDPAWSPDGTKIAFHSDRDGNLEIYVMDAADGSGLANLTNSEDTDWFPVWRPTPQVP